jgi:ATP-dependent Lhr-like helicase
VVLLGSPKSVARALQRIGRSGHKLNEQAKGRIIVLDRDDMVECSVLLKAAIEKKIDKLHIPVGATDVLAQQLFGMAIERVRGYEETFFAVRRSHCFHSLSCQDFEETVKYLAGEYASLEERSVYAKIWWDREKNDIGKRGKLARLLYLTNVGTIPDETKVAVKIGEEVIGTIDEAFLERLKPGDVFVLGGETYEFKFSRGLTAQVKSSAGRPPTVPSWASEMARNTSTNTVNSSQNQMILRKKMNIVQRTSRNG